MLTPEYRVGFRVLREKIGSWTLLSMAIPAFFKALMVKHKVEEGSNKAEAAKADLKNHFQLLANMYKMLDKRYGKMRQGRI
jgi:uncharacterized membrane-anchored protein YhcB (DUF1043 family)